MQNLYLGVSAGTYAMSTWEFQRQLASSQHLQVLSNSSLRSRLRGICSLQFAAKWHLWVLKITPLLIFPLHCSTHTALMTTRRINGFSFFLSKAASFPGRCRSRGWETPRLTKCPAPAETQFWHQITGSHFQSWCHTTVLFAPTLFPKHMRTAG